MTKQEEDRKLDPALKAANYHGVIQERLYLIDQIVLKLSEKKHFGEIARLERAFAQELPAHFRHEEELVFPVLDLRGKPEHKALVVRLRREHAELAARSQAIADTFTENLFPLSPEVVEKVNRELKEFSESIRRHAEVEDKELFTAFHELGSGRTPA